MFSRLVEDLRESPNDDKRVSILSFLKIEIHLMYSLLNRE